MVSLYYDHIMILRGNIYWTCLFVEKQYLLFLLFLLLKIVDFINIWKENRKLESYRNCPKNRPTMTTFWRDKIKVRFFLFIFFIVSYWRKKFFTEISALLSSMGTSFRLCAPNLEVFSGKNVLPEMSFPQRVPQQQASTRQHSRCCMA